MRQVETRRVVHLIDHLLVGGPTSLLQDVIKHADRARFSYTVCCLTECGEGLEIFVDNGVPVRSIRVAYPKSPVLFALTAWWLPLAGVVRLFFWLRRERPDVVHTHLFYSNLLGRIAALAARVPVIVCHVHNEYFNNSRLHVMADRFLAPHTDAIIAVSDAVRRFTVSQQLLDSRNVVVIENTIDVSRFEELVSRELAEELVPLPANARFVVGALCRLRKQKGIDIALHAFARLAETRDDVHFLLVGDSREKPRLLRLARRLGICRQLSMLGNRSDIQVVLRRMDVFVMPSYWEGLPLAALEAMAAGLPIICSDIASLTNIVCHSVNGMVARVGNVDDFFRAIEVLARDEPMRIRLGNRARTDVLARLSCHGLAERYEALYLEIMEGKRNRGKVL